MISKVRQLREYFVQIQTDEAEIDHFWFFHGGKMMSWFWIWYDTEEWTKASRVSKVISFVLIHLLVLLWILVAFRIYQEYTYLSPSRMGESFCGIIGGLYAYFSYIRYALERSAISKVIQVIDRKCLAVPNDSPRFQKQWQETTRIYKLEGKIMMAAIAIGVVVAFSQSLFALISGTLFYDSYVLISDESYSWPWWLQYIHQGGVMLYMGYLGGLINFIALDLLYQINRLFRVQADTIMELCLETNCVPQQEYAKLSGALKEILELYEISSDYKRFLKPYVFLLGTASFILFATGGVAIIIESKNGWISAILRSITFPASCFFILFVWVLGAESFTDSVEAVKDSLYNCNWIDAPAEIRKLILTYKILLIQPNYIGAPPFVVLNMELLTDTIKRTYYLLAILSDVLLR